MSRHKLKGGDGVGLLELIRKVRERAERTLGGQLKTVSCYEAGYDGYWLDRLLRASGIENFVFDPASIAVEQRARRAKTDRIDGEHLLRTLMAYVRGEPRVVRVVRVPSVEQEDARRATRERGRLIKEQTAHSNRLKALLRLIGVAPGNPRRRDWLNWVGEQRDWQGEPVPPRLMAELEREHGRLMLVCRQLQALAPVSGSEPAEQSAAATRMAEQQEQLQQLKGVGPVFAATLAQELFYKDFRNRREVAGYCGLTGSPWQSGNTHREQGISKAGNPRVRHKAVEMAWLWLRHQPGSALSERFRQRAARGDSRNKRSAIVALARQLIVALWRYLTTGLLPDGAVLSQA
jgi:transposase